MSPQKNGNQERVREMLEDGLVPKVIAKKLGIAVTTVYVHKYRLSKRKKDEEE